MATTDFGFYPIRYDVNVGSFEIITLGDFDDAVTRVMSDPGVHKDWIYAPLREQASLGISGTRTLPYVSRVFGLPKTHRLTHTSDDEKRLTFLVWVFGFFVGMRMSNLEAGFLDAAALRQGTSTDMVWCGDSLQKAMLTADDFYETHKAKSEIERAIRAVIHSFLLADLPTLLDFEQFLHLYTAADAAYAVHTHIYGEPKQKPSHAARIAHLCEQLKIPTPWWADRNSKYVATQRNNAIHEGLFFGEPWGFTIFGGTTQADPRERMVLLELQKLMCRILMAMLGVRDETYLQSAVDDRQRHGVHLP
jgi:hypothetical protein